MQLKRVSWFPVLPMSLHTPWEQGLFLISSHPQHLAQCLAPGSIELNDQKMGRRMAEETGPGKIWDPILAPFLGCNYSLSLSWQSACNSLMKKSRTVITKFESCSSFPNPNYHNPSVLWPSSFSFPLPASSPHLVFLILYSEAALVITVSFLSCTTWSHHGSKAPPLSSIAILPT